MEVNKCCLFYTPSGYDLDNPNLPKYFYYCSECGEKTLENSYERCPFCKRLIVQKDPIGYMEWEEKL